MTRWQWFKWWVLRFGAREALPEAPVFDERKVQAPVDHRVPGVLHVPADVHIRPMPPCEAGHAYRYVAGDRVRMALDEANVNRGFLFCRRCGALIEVTQGNFEKHRPETLVTHPGDVIRRD